MPENAKWKVVVFISYFQFEDQSVFDCLVTDGLPLKPRLNSKLNVMFYEGKIKNMIKNNTSFFKIPY